MYVGKMIDAGNLDTLTVVPRIYCVHNWDCDSLRVS